MITFRSSSLLALAFLANCANDMPPRDSELGKIVRLPEAEMRASLRKWARSRLSDKPRLSRELRDAGFTSGNYEAGCQLYDWSGNDWGEIWPRIVFIDVCERSVDVTAVIRDDRY